MARKDKAAKGAGLQGNGKSIFQITPIIIKGGSLDFRIGRLKFVDDANKEHTHFKVKEKGGIYEISITGEIKSMKGDGKTKPLDILFDNSKTAEITINFFDESRAKKKTKRSALA